MASHKFKVDQGVHVSPGSLNRWMPHGADRVVRQLPPDIEDNQYRIKSVEDGHERVVRESQLD